LFCEPVFSASLYFEQFLCVHPSRWNIF
jgi:hypothetical protein